MISESRLIPIFLQYYCEQCWASIHSRPGREFHKPLVKEGADRLELTPLYHQRFIQRFQQLFTPSFPLVTIVIQWFAGQGPSPSDGAKSFSQLANHHFWFVGHQDCLWGGERGEISNNWALNVSHLVIWNWCGPTENSGQYQTSLTLFWTPFNFEKFGKYFFRSSWVNQKTLLKIPQVVKFTITLPLTRQSTSLQTCCDYPSNQNGDKIFDTFWPQNQETGQFSTPKARADPKKCSTILTFSSHKNMVESARTYTFNQLKRIWCNTLKLLLQKPSCQYLWVSASIHASSIVSISH